MSILMLTDFGNLKKLYYCPIRDNRPADDSDKVRPYRHADSPGRSSEELEHGRIVEIKDFPKHRKVRLFRVVLSSRKHRLNDMARNDTSAVREVCGAYVGQQSSFIVKPGNIQESRDAGVGNSVLSEIISAVRYLSGYVSEKMLMRQTERFIRLNMGCCLLI
jgi:hypothetical protein